jgi:lysophospholipase L1-like esterase
VNDVTGLTSSQRWLSNLAAISAALKNKFGAGQVLFSSLPPMHLFPALPQPLRWWLGTRAKQLNVLMEQLSANSSGCSFLNIPYSTDRQLVAADGFHPGALAYKLWGEFVAEVIHAQ